MKSITLALVLFAGLFAAFTCPAGAWFPHDAINEERAQMLVLLHEVRGVLEAQRELIKGLPPEKQDELVEQKHRHDRADRQDDKRKPGAGRKICPALCRQLRVGVVPAFGDATDQVTRQA